MQVTVVTRLSDKKKLLENEGINVVSIDIGRSGTNPLKELTTVWKIKKVLHREKSDIVQLLS